MKLKCYFSPLLPMYNAMLWGPDVRWGNAPNNYRGRVDAARDNYRSTDRQYDLNSHLVDLIEPVTQRTEALCYSHSETTNAPFENELDGHP